MMQKCEPFLRWAGGKRWLASKIAPFLRSCNDGTYFEPFLGGGSVFFELQPERSVLADLNSDLIATYHAIKTQPEKVIQKIRKMEVSSESYYRIRVSRPRSPVGVAARFIFLNRTCFNGVYRTNLKGEFNVPYGGGDRTPAKLCSGSALFCAKKALAHAEIDCGDFEETISKARVGDLVYCDPAYTVAHGNNGFVKYNEKVFSWNDQIRLRDAAARAAKKGVTVVVSNASHKSISDLYHPFRPIEVSRQSSVGVASSRAIATEFLYVLSDDSKKRTALKKILKG